MTTDARYPLRLEHYTSGQNCSFCGYPHLSDTARCPSCGCSWRKTMTTDARPANERDTCWWLDWWERHPKAFEYVEPISGPITATVNPHTGALYFETPFDDLPLSARVRRYRRPSPETLATMQRMCGRDAE